MTLVKDIYNYINSIAPYNEMEEWDNSGFILGDEEKTVSTVVMALDGTKAAADYAKSVEADLLLTHHPIIFNPVKKIVKGTAVYELINNDIATMCAHTSYDKAAGGINDSLAKLLDLKNTKKLENGYVVVGELEREMSIDDFAVLVGDCFVTSDLKYHEMLDASESGFAVINAGHFETENVPFLMLKEKLEKEFEEVEFIVAPVSNPVLEI